MARPANLKLTPEAKQKVIEAYKKFGNLSICAKAVECSRQAISHMRKSDKKFGQAMDEAFLEYCDKWEAILEQRASDPKAHPLLIMFKMKSIMPDKYKDKSETKITGQIKIVSAIPRPIKEGKTTLIEDKPQVLALTEQGNQPKQGQ